MSTLSFSVLNHTATVGATEQLAQYSMFTELKDILVRAPRLKELDVKFEYNWIRSEGTTGSPRVLNLPLEPGDRIPPLQSLSFSGPEETYEFDPEHCKLLRQCMDWSQLRRLDLRLSCPQHLFAEVGSQLSGLRSLTMGIRTGARRYRNWKCGPLTCDSLDQAAAFIEAVPGLHELNLTDLDASVKTIAPAILGSQNSLRKFSYLSSLYRHRPRNTVSNRVWTTHEIRWLYRQNLKLSQMEVDFPLDGGKWVSIQLINS